MDLNRKKAIGQFVVAAIFLACGSFAWNYSTTAKTMGHASLSWPSVNGTVVRRFFRSSTTGRGRSTVGIEYKYSVHGEEYRGDRIKYGSQNDWSVGSSPDEVGKFIKVYFNPQNPSISIVEPGYQAGTVSVPKWSGIACLAVAFLACAHGIVLLVTKNQ
jgi:hypothetical protein